MAHIFGESLMYQDMLSWFLLSQSVLISLFPQIHGNFTWQISKKVTNYRPPNMTLNERGSTRPFLIYPTAIVHQKSIAMKLWFFILLKKWAETYRKSKHHQPKINRLHYSAIPIKTIKRTWNLFQIFTTGVQELEKLVICCSNIRWKLILILTRILNKQAKVYLLMCSNI